jgi:hypothetical protein
MLHSVLALLLTLFTAAAHAAPDSARLKAAVEAIPACQNSLRHDDQNLYVGFGLYRRGFEEPRGPIPGFVRVRPLDGGDTFKLITQDGVVDTIADGNTLYVLTFTAVEVWDLATRQRTNTVPTYAKAGPWAYYEHARGFARYQDKLVIAHGRLGVSIFNLKTQRLSNQFRVLERQLPMESAALHVAVSGNRAYIVFDNISVSNQAFRGIVIVDLDQEKVISELNGMDPGADAVVTDGKSLIVSFWGLPLWKYSLAALDRAQSTIPEPQNRIAQFPVKGHPLGKPFIDDNFYYSCYRIEPEKRGEAIMLGGVALDRKALRLD